MSGHVDGVVSLWGTDITQGDCIRYRAWWCTSIHTVSMARMRGLSARRAITIAITRTGRSSSVRACFKTLRRERHDARRVADRGKSERSRQAY